MQLLFQSTTPPNKEARLLHGTLKRAPKRMHTDFCIFNCMSNNFGSSSQTFSSVCRQKLTAQLAIYRQHTKNTDTKIGQIANDTC